MGWLSNLWNKAASTGQKIGASVAKIGEKVGNVVKQGEKLGGTVGSMVSDPFHAITNPSESLGNLAKGVGGVLSSGAGVLSEGNNLGKIVMGDEVWGAVGGGALGMAGQWGDEAGRGFNMAGRRMKGEHVSNAEITKLGKDTVGTTLEYGLNRLSGGMAKKYGVSFKGKSKMAKKVVQGSQSGTIGDVLGTASGIKQYQSGRY